MKTKDDFRKVRRVEYIVMRRPCLAQQPAGSAASQVANECLQLQKVEKTEVDVLVCDCTAFWKMQVCRSRCLIHCPRCVASFPSGAEALSVPPPMRVAQSCSHVLAVEGALGIVPVEELSEQVPQAKPHGRPNGPRQGACC